MNTIQQKRFVRQLIDTVEINIVAVIDAGKTPDEWDGTELRWYIAEKFADCVFGDVSKRRKAEYKNTVLTKNL
jgi:hypothetical protein